MASSTGNPLAKVSTGQPLKIPADAYNAFIDAAVTDRARRKLFGAAPGPVVPYGDTAIVLNASETDIGRFGILGLGDALIRPAINANEFASKPAFIGLTPAATHRGKFGIALEPIPAGACGPMVVGGLCPVQVALLDPSHVLGEFADVYPDETGWLKESGSGSARILWCEGEEDRDGEIAWCLVLIGGGTSPGGSFTVKVYIDGGSSGSSSTTCSYTYTVKTLSGKIVGTALSPEKRRYESVPYTTTPDGSTGMAYFDGDGVLHLWDANELPDLIDCSSM